MKPINNTQNIINETEGLVQQKNLELVPLALQGSFTPEAWATLTYDQREILSNIDKLPSKLIGIVPESIWETLSFDQKLEFLTSHGVLATENISITHKDIEAPGFGGGMEGSFSEEKDDNIEGSVEIADSASMHEEFSEAVQAVEHMEAQYESEMQQNVEVSQEESTVDNPQNKPASYDNKSFDDNQTKVSGYQPDGAVVSNLNKYADGSVGDGSTWVAHMFLKFREALTPSQN